MRLLYQLWNQGEKPVEVDEETITPASLGKGVYLSDEIKERLGEFSSLDLVPCLVCPCRQGVLDADLSAAAAQQAKASLEMRRESRVLAGTATLNQPKERSGEGIELPADPGAAGPFEIMSGRLYLVDAARWRPEFIKGMTVLLDITDAGLPYKAKKGLLHARWPVEDDVDEKVLAGAVRLCAASLGGVNQRVMIAASREAGIVIAACVLREALGVDAKTALAILKGSCTWSVVQKVLRETIEKYRMS